LNINQNILEQTELNRTGIIPVYHQLQEVLLEWIADGIYKPHDRLPSENELGRHFNVSRNTAQKALKTIVEKGAAYRVQGRGTFVADKQITYSITAKLSFSAEIIGLTKETRSILNYAKQQKASAHVSRLLEIEEGEQVATIQRIRLVDETPAALMTSYLRSRLVPGLLEKLAPGASLFKTIKDEYGLEVGSGSETLQVENADAYEAQQLGVSEGDAVFIIERISNATDGTVIELAKTVLRGDISKFSVELS
jgi:GntR family transcriptional regulator